MKITLSFFSFIICFTFLSACGNSGNANETEPKTNVKRKANDPCLTVKSEKLSEILTSAMIEKYTDGKEYEMDEKVLESGKGSYNYCQYSWPGEGTHKIENAIMSLDVPNTCSIQLSGVKWIDKDDPVADFNNVYRTMTEEEMKKVKEEFNKQLEKSEEISENSKTPGKKVGEGLLDQLNKTKYEDVSGVGDAAKWEISFSKYSTPSAGILYVQMGNERFKMDVDLGGEDTSKSKAAAIEIAKKIIADCK